jgi:hypothetical protein
MTLTLAPRDSATARRPKETLDLTGSWTLDKMPKRLEARLFWFTRGKGTPDAGLVETQQVDVPSLKGERRFRFPLPDGPYSFSGRLITLGWAVELVADDEVARWEFTMSPDGNEIDICRPLPSEGVAVARR